MDGKCVCAYMCVCTHVCACSRKGGGAETSRKGKPPPPSPPSGPTLTGVGHVRPQAGWKISLNVKNANKDFPEGNPTRHHQVYLNVRF